MVATLSGQVNKTVASKSLDTDESEPSSIRGSAKRFHGPFILFWKLFGRMGSGTGTRSCNGTFRHHLNLPHSLVAVIA